MVNIFHLFKWGGGMGLGGDMENTPNVHSDNIKAVFEQNKR